MPKTFPILLEVEEIALGPVLRKLNDMPGIVKLDLQLGHGGEGPGKEKLMKAAAEHRNNGGSAEQIVVKALLQGPKHIGELSRIVGGKKSRAYGAVHQLKKKGLTEVGDGKGMHQLTRKAMAQLGAVPALPPPAKVSHGPAGRATPGSGNIVLRTVLADGPLTPKEVRERAAAQGMSAKSITGVLDRAKKGGLIKKNGIGYELTAKGQKIETGAQTNG